MLKKQHNLIIKKKELYIKEKMEEKQEREHEAAIAM